MKPGTPSKYATEPTMIVGLKRSTAPMKPGWTRIVMGAIPTSVRRVATPAPTVANPAPIPVTIPSISATALIMTVTPPPWTARMTPRSA